jgi:hypothetical protein
MKDDSLKLKKIDEDIFDIMRNKSYMYAEKDISFYEVTKENIKKILIAPESSSYNKAKELSSIFDQISKICTQDKPPLLWQKSIYQLFLDEKNTTPELINRIKEKIYQINNAITKQKKEIANDILIKNDPLDLQFRKWIMNGFLEEAQQIHNTNSKTENDPNTV